MAQRSAATSQAPNVTVLDLQPLLTPIAIVFSSILLSCTMWFSLHGIALPTVNTQVTPTPTAAKPTVSIDQIKNIFAGNYLKFGDPNSKLLLVEVGDPSCPYCHLAGGKHPELNKSVGGVFLLKQDGGTYVAPVPEFKKLLDEGKAAFAYIYDTGHGNGKLAMQALYCAYDKNRFWEVHDLLMSKAGYDLQNDVIKNDVAQSGKLADFLAEVIDKGYMKDCLESGKYASRVNSDEQFAATLGITGTPAFFVNTTLFGGAYNYTDIQPAIDAALK